MIPHSFINSVLLAALQNNACGILSQSQMLSDKDWRLEYHIVYLEDSVEISLILFQIFLI